MKRFNSEMKRDCLGVDNEGIRALLSYSWPGNVRELKNVIERAMILCGGGSITMADLPAEITGDLAGAEHSAGLRDGVRAYESEHIRRVLVETGGNKEEAARRLGIDPSTLYRKMAQLSLVAQDSPEPPLPGA